MNIVSLLLAVALSAGNAEFEKSATEGAAAIALDRLKTETLERGLAKGVLAEAMLAAPEVCVKRSEAEKLCRERYAQELVRQYRASADEIVRSLGLDSSGGDLDQALIDQVLSRHFVSSFATERTDACNRQAKEIALKVKPDEADLERQGESAARVWLTETIASAAKMPVFEENHQYISEKIVDPLLADAWKERKRQREYLMRTSADAASPESLAKELEANLRKNVAERKAKCNDPVRTWGVFPLTLKESLPSAVERRLVARAVKVVGATPFEVSADEVREQMSRERDSHRVASESDKTFTSYYRALLCTGVVERAVADAPNADRAAFRDFLHAHADDPEFVKAVESRVRREAMPKWRAVRAEAVKDEVARLWPSLNDGTWYPDAELADRTAARSDYAVAVKDWRSERSLNGLEKSESALFEESDRSADASVAVAFELARSAIAAQNALVEASAPQVLESAKDLSKGVFTSSPSLAEVVEMLTKRVTESWTDRRVEELWKGGKLPANADEQHVALFPSVTRTIERVAREILEELEKPEPQPEPQPESPPEEPKPEEPPQDSPSDSNSASSNEPLDLCTISFRLSGGQVTVSAKRGGETVAERSAPATAKGFENAVSEVGAIVGRKVFGLK